MPSVIPKLMCLDPADAVAGGPAERAGNGLKWVAILAFVAAPFVCVWTTVLTIPDPPPEHVEKAELLRRRTTVDTVVVGDSRVVAIAEEPFAANGWKFFNMGLSGVSPEDMAMQLKYAMLHGQIRRVAMGVSFEGMTARYPFEFSRFHGAGPFVPAEIEGFATVGVGPRPLQRTVGIRKFLRSELLPITNANPRLRWRVARALGRELSGFLPNGTMDYVAIREQIAAGDYDFARQRDAKIFFTREDSELRYLEKPELAPYALQLYRKVFSALREAKIACVVFETGRTAEYQQMIEARAELLRLQQQWREFFRAESYGSVKFLDAAATCDCYVANDFIDAVHFIGPTATQLAARLADELAALEKASTDNGPASQRAKTTP